MSKRTFYIYLIYISLKQYDDVRVFNFYDVLHIFKKLYQRDLKDNLKRFKINIYEPISIINIRIFNILLRKHDIII